MTVGVEKAERSRISDQESAKQSEGAIEKVFHCANGLLMLKSLGDEDYNGVSFKHMKAIKEQQLKLDETIKSFFSKLADFLLKTLNGEFAKDNCTPQSVHNQMILLAPLLWIIQRKDMKIFTELQSIYCEKMTILMTKTLKDFFSSTKKNIVSISEEGQGRLIDLANSNLGKQEDEMRMIDEQYYLYYKGEENGGKISVAAAFRKATDFVVPLVNGVRTFSIHFFCGGGGVDETLENLKQKSDYKNIKAKRNIQNVRLNPQDVVNNKTVQLILTQIFNGLFPELMKVANNDNRSFYQMISMSQIILSTLEKTKDNKFIQTIMESMQLKLSQDIKAHITSVVYIFLIFIFIYFSFSYLFRAIGWIVKNQILVNVIY